MQEIIKQRITKLQNILKRNGIDYLLLPVNDDFLSDRTPSPIYNNRMKWLTGFEGGFASLLVGVNETIFFSNLKYIDELKEKFKDLATVLKISKVKPHQWLIDNTSRDKVTNLAIDQNLHSMDFIEGYKNFFSLYSQDSIEIKILENNPVDKIWIKDRILNPKSQIFIHPMRYCGWDTLYKRRKLQNYIKNYDADALVIDNPCNVCWLLNIRGNDIPYTPIARCRAIFYKNLKVDLFIDTELDFSLENSEIKEWLHKVQIYKLSDFKAKLVQVTEANDVILVNKDINYSFYSIIKSNHLSEVSITSICPCSTLKTVKNSTEIDGAIKAHKFDGQVFIKLLMHLDKEKKSNYSLLSELSLASKAKELKSYYKEYISESFEPIVAFDGNGAITHYSPKKNTDKNIKDSSFCLFDLGSQYKSGTTDVSRTIALKTPTQEQKERYTRVLKGHIALAKAKFYEGTKGNQLDFVPRQYLNDVGLDYGHATGHGVGSVLDVHEDGCLIDEKNGDFILKEGMIITIEPGFYKKDEYGIRIENVFLVEKYPEDELIHLEDDIIYNTENHVSDTILYFRPLTLVPLDIDLIDTSILTKKEKEALIEYHESIFKILYMYLNKKEQIWLVKIINKYKKLKTNED